MTARSELPGMFVPPVDEHGVVPAHSHDWDDRRLPKRMGRYTDDEREIHPLGHYLGPDQGPCLPPGLPGEDRMARWGRQRHLFDVLHTAGGQGYDEDMKSLPVAFEMVLTCVRCGVVIRIAGQATSDEDGGVHHAAQLDPAPLQAGALVAQQIRADRGWSREVDATWAVYADGVRVGMIADARGARGRRYVHGRLGDDGPLIEGATPLAVLRKLSKTFQAADSRPSAVTA